MAVDKKNIFLEQTRESLPYASRQRQSGRSFPTRNNPSAHATFIAGRLRECNAQALEPKQVAAIRYKQGVYLEFSSKEGFPLKTESLENLSKHIRLLNVRQEGEVEKATVYVPAGQEAYFLEKVQAYADSLSGEDKPKNNDLVRSIEDVKTALLESFWVGNRADIPNEYSVWCEIWLRYEDGHMYEAEQDFVTACTDTAIEVNASRIVFPERIVRMGRANKSQLKRLIESCAYLAEVRKAPESTGFFYDMNQHEQQEWVDELLSRTEFVPSNATVCLLDTGITAAHRLLAPAVSESRIQAVDSTWRTDDQDGHGTQMAGVALYRDLKARLTSTSREEIVHTLESVKILHPTESHEPALYGAVTEQAVALAEIENPTADRAICMAVTAPSYSTNDGSPSSWSGAIDSITSGADGSNDKRLMFISAGNVTSRELSASHFHDANILHGVENPGQAWNAVTVGAYNDNVTLDDPQYKGFTAVADQGDISPYSSTSYTWDAKWPIKPEILLDGGNMVTNGQDYMSCPPLSVLTTDNQPLKYQFAAVWGTSSATAQAAWMAAQLFAEYPGIWPETVRALLVHSARWTQKMVSKYNANDKKTKGRRDLLRICGYGIPDLNRAIQCHNNSVNMVIQGEIQPFIKHDNRVAMNEMHLHRIPWPTEVLQSLSETPVEMRVTLSYFIEPGPGEKGWKDRYRYPSASLRFDVINDNETIEDFKKRVNVQMRGEDKKDSGDGSSGSDRWFLGTTNRDVGSIHSDVMSCSAVDLCNTNYIAVYPVIGWWRERSYLGKFDSQMRYSLVVSISTPKNDVDLYTPIVTQIATTIPIGV